MSLLKIEARIRRDVGLVIHPSVSLIGLQMIASIVRKEKERK
jgi:hypothetical protein